MPRASMCDHERSTGPTPAWEPVSGAVTRVHMASDTIHRIQPARFKPGQTPATTADPATVGDSTTGSTSVLRGKALIFWDPERPGM